MPPQRPSQRNEIVDWYNSIPPITKALFTLSIATTTLSTLGLIQPSSLILYWPTVKSKLQLWRLVSCFFVNKLSLGFAFNVYFLYRNSLQLETEIFQGQPADYMFFHLITSTMQLAAATVFDHLYVLSDGLLLAVAYLWSQHNRETPVSFMFGIRFKALYLPWAMIASDFLMSGGEIPRASIAGMIASHIYYYLTTVYPSQGGTRYLQTPQFLKRLFPGAPARGFRGGFGNQSSSGSSTSANTNMFGRHSWGSGQRLGS